MQTEIDSMEFPQPVNEHATLQNIHIEGNKVYYHVSMNMDIDKSQITKELQEKMRNECIAEIVAEIKMKSDIQTVMNEDIHYIYSCTNRSGKEFVFLDISPEELLSAFDK